MDNGTILLLAVLAYFLFFKKQPIDESINADEELTDPSTGNYYSYEKHPTTTARKREEKNISDVTRTTETPPSGDFHIAAGMINPHLIGV